MSKISGLFAKNNVSISEVKQVLEGDGNAQIVIITHVCGESLVKKTLAKLSEFSDVNAVKGVIRMED